jgi:hypothetical protein
MLASGGTGTKDKKSMTFNSNNNSPSKFGGKFGDFFASDTDTKDDNLGKINNLNNISQAGGDTSTSNLLGGSNN